MGARIRGTLGDIYIYIYIYIYYIYIYNIYTLSIRSPSKRATSKVQKGTLSGVSLVLSRSLGAEHGNVSLGGMARPSNIILRVSCYNYTIKDPPSPILIIKAPTLQWKEF